VGLQCAQTSRLVYYRKIAYTCTSVITGLYGRCEIIFVFCG